MADDENIGFTETFGKLKSAGTLARAKIYQGYITRISNKEELKLAEKKHFDELDKEFSEIMDSEKPQENFKAGEVIEKLGISERSLKWHTARDNLRRNKNGTYSLETLLAFEEKYKRKKGIGGKVKSVMSQQEEADLRYRVARAQWQEASVKQLYGELIPKDEMAKEWGKRLNTLFMGIRLWTNRLSPRLEGKTRDEMMRIFEDEIYLLMETFAKKGRYCPEVDGAIELKK